VIIIGCGFGGLAATRALARAAVRITLLDRTNHHAFQPLLYQVATAGLAAPAIAAPIRFLLRKQRNVTPLLAEVRAIDLAAHQVRLDNDHTLAYDFLIVATGTTHSYFGHDDWAPFAPGLKTLEDAQEIRRHLLLGFEYAEREPETAASAGWLTFAVVGAGPTGVELAGTVAEIARHTLPQEFRRIDSRRTRVVLIEAGERVLSAFSPRLSAKAMLQLERLGVEVRLRALVTNIDALGVSFADGTRLAARTVVWAAGVAASPLGRTLGVPLDRAGRVEVLPTLDVPGHPDVFVIGDLASVKSDGRAVPGVGAAAKQMGRRAAQNVLARVAQRPQQVFHYRDYGMLATIGRHAAVGVIGPVEISGPIAWLFWLLVHLFYLIGFRNRIVVLFDWAWAYLSFERSARIFSPRS
jgi:NADH:ubiquinone reductase (H+-translocating)